MLVSESGRPRSMYEPGCRPDASRYAKKPETETAILAGKEERFDHASTEHALTYVQDDDTCRSMERQLLRFSGLTRSNATFLIHAPVPERSVLGPVLRLGVRRPRDQL